MPNLTKPVLVIARTSLGNYLVTVTAEVVFSPLELKLRQSGLRFKADAVLVDVDVPGIGDDRSDQWYTMFPYNVGYSFSSKLLPIGPAARSHEPLQFSQEWPGSALNVDSVGLEEFRARIAISHPLLNAVAESDLLQIAAV